jgi:ABC-type transport system involved in multi-copper enzyme maturation permease subunit
MSTPSSTTALRSARQETHSLARPHPLTSVLTWELRRVLANRLFWLQALCFFVLVLFALWLGRQPITFNQLFGSFSGVVAGTSGWGLVTSLRAGLILLLGLLLPFVNADGVTRDLERRTHELLMTTLVPSWAYVWGRYLMGLLVSLGLAVLVLAAMLGTGVLLHLTVSAYPAPDTGNVLILWGGMVVSATILLSSVSFTLGTLLPRQSLLIKIGILLAWFIGTFMLPRVLSDTTSPPAWYSAWDPTSAVTTERMLLQYSAEFQHQTTHLTSQAQLQHIILAIENQVPNLGTWLVPHLLLAGASLLLVALSALRFQRFRNTFGG